MNNDREIEWRVSDAPVAYDEALRFMEQRVAAIREGAYDFLQKPYVPEHLSAVVARAIEQRRLKQELQLLSERVAAHEGLQAHIVGASPAIASMSAVISVISAMWVALWSLRGSAV